MSTAISHGTLGRIGRTWDFFIHGHVLAAIVEGGLLGLMVFLIEHHIHNRDEELRRKTELIHRVTHDCQAAISVLASYKTNQIWLETHPETDAKDELGRTRDQKLRVFDQTYGLFIQQPRIEGICRQIVTYFQRKDVQDKAESLDTLITERLWPEKDLKKIRELVQKDIATALEGLVNAMEQEVEADRKKWW